MSIKIELLIMVIGFLITISSFYLKINTDNKKSSEKFGMQQGKIETKLEEISNHNKDIFTEVQGIKKEAQINQISMVGEMARLTAGFRSIESDMGKIDLKVEKAHTRIDQLLNETLQDISDALKAISCNMKASDSNK